MNAVALLNAASSAVVTTALFPVVHAILTRSMDCRDKPGNDESGVGLGITSNRDSRLRGTDTVVLEGVQ